MYTPILFKDDINKIREYLSNNQDYINSPFCCQTPLIYAVEKERADVIDCLIEYKCDINHQDYVGRTALHFACRQKNINIDIIQRLIGNDANGLIRDKWGNTPLHYASQNCKDVNIIHQLVFVSDPNIINNHGRNPLMECCMSNKNIQVISALINVTYNINLQDFSGKTALYWSCAIKKNYNAIQLLLCSGSDPFIQDNKGNLPYDLSREEIKRIIDEFMSSKNL